MATKATFKYKHIRVYIGLPCWLSSTALFEQQYPFAAMKKKRLGVTFKVRGIANCDVQGASAPSFGHRASEEWNEQLTGLLASWGAGTSAGGIMAPVNVGQNFGEGEGTAGVLWSNKIWSEFKRVYLTKRELVKLGGWCIRTTSRANMWKIFQVGLSLIESTNDTLMIPSLVLEASFITMNLMEPDYNISYTTAKSFSRNCDLIWL